jgi:hypothetical protein
MEHGMFYGSIKSDKGCILKKSEFPGIGNIDGPRRKKSKERSSIHVNVIGDDIQYGVSTPLIVVRH